MITSTYCKHVWIDDLDCNTEFCEKQLVKQYKDAWIIDRNFDLCSALEDMRLHDEIQEMKHQHARTLVVIMIVAQLYICLAPALVAGMYESMI